MLDTTPRKILVGVTGDEDVEAAVGFAADEARRRGVGVHLLHVVHPVLIAPDGIPLTVEDGAVRKLGRQALAQAARSLEHELGDDLPVSTELARGAVAQVLVDTAKHACVTVLQHQRMGRSGFVSTLSTTNPVAALSPSPVIAVPDWWSESPTRPDITVGVADAQASGEVVRAALGEARRRGCRVRLLHAWYYNHAYDDLVFEGAAGDAHSARQVQDLLVGLGPLLEEYPDVEATVVVEHARTADALVRESHRVALLVVGRHRHTIPLGPHLGSVARAVLKRSTCPVLVIDPVASTPHTPEASAAGSTHQEASHV